MEYSEIELTVKDILADKLDMDRNKININSDLFNELGLDSFGSIEIVFELEEKFDIKILEADIEKAKIVKDIVDYIAGRLEEKKKIPPIAS